MTSSLRFPSCPTRLAELWLAQDSAASRREFLMLAIARGNVAAIGVACAQPSSAASLERGAYLRLSEIIAKHDMPQILDGLLRMDGGHVEALRDLELGNPYRHMAVDAVRSQALGVWRWVLNQGFDPSAPGKSGTSIAYMIATHGWVEGMVAINLPAAELVSWRDSFQRTLLHGAARYAKPDMVHYLLSLGADPSARDKNHRTPLFLCLAGNTEGMGPERGALWQQTALALAEAGCTLDEHCGKTARSQTLRAYLADRCPEIGHDLAVVDAFHAHRALEASTTPANALSATRRI